MSRPADRSAAKTQTLIGGHPTHLRRLGHGPRRLLALHCSLAHGGAFQPLSAATGAALSIVAPDFPGHGHSADPPDPRDIHDISTAVAKALLLEIGGGEKVDLLGHSYGGSVALRTALDAPELVRSLTLIEPVAFAAARDQDGAGLALWMARQGEVDRLLSAGDSDAALRLFNEDWGNGSPYEDLAPHQKAYMRERLHLIGAFSHIAWDDSPSLFAKGRLEALDLPVLLLEGAASPPIVSEITRGLDRRLPQCRREVIAGAGHMLPLTHAAAVAPILLKHLQG